MYFSIGNNCFLNYIFIHSWTFGTCTHMGHLQGKLISLTHWPLTILPQALKITAWCWLQAPSCTNPQQQGGKGGQQHWASLPVTKLFKTLMPFENVTWSDQDMDMLYMPGWDETVHWQKISFFTTAVYSLHIYLPLIWSSPCSWHLTRHFGIHCRAPRPEMRERTNMRREVSGRSSLPLSKAIMHFYSLINQWGSPAITQTKHSTSAK